MQTQMPALVLYTDAINHQGTIDPRYTCDSDNSSPELRWENIPPSAAGFALILEDKKDTPITHWLVYNIPPNVHHLPAGIPPQESLPNGIHQGVNSFGKLGYSGPCPAEGEGTHPYFFRLWVLSQLPRLPLRAKRAELLFGLEPFIIAEAHVVGAYRRIIHRIAG